MTAPLGGMLYPPHLLGHSKGTLFYGVSHSISPGFTVQPWGCLTHIMECLCKHYDTAVLCLGINQKNMGIVRFVPGKRGTIFPPTQWGCTTPPPRRRCTSSEVVTAAMAAHNPHPRACVGSVYRVLSWGVCTPGPVVHAGAGGGGTGHWWGCNGPPWRACWAPLPPPWRPMWVPWVRHGGPCWSPAVVGNTSQRQPTTARATHRRHGRHKGPT